MIQLAPPPDDGDQTADGATDGATDVPPRPADDLDPPAGDLDDERRRGYEPL